MNDERAVLVEDAKLTSMRTEIACTCLQRENLAKATCFHRILPRSVPDEYKPVVFTDGVRQPFPCPTRKARRIALNGPRLLLTSRTC